MQEEGLLPLVMEGIQFLKSRVFEFKRYYLYEMALNEPMKFEPAPKIKDFVFEIVLTNQRLDELVAKGFNFGIQGIRARKKLDKGAVMFCVFIAKKLACIHWAAITREAKEMIVIVPTRVDFLNNEVYLGWSETRPEYRQLGLSEYLISEKLKLFIKMGKTTGKWTVVKSNAASNKLTVKIGARIYGEARYLNILWWKSWKEQHLVQEASEYHSAKGVGAR